MAFWFFGGDLDVSMEYVLVVINEMEYNLFAPFLNYYGLKKGEFINYSYEKSGMQELKKYLINHKNEDPIMCVESFRSMVDHFACAAKTEDAKFMFSVYYDTATDILDRILNIN